MPVKEDVELLLKAGPKEKAVLCLILLIFVYGLAVQFRLAPTKRGTVIDVTADDPVFHYRMTEYVLEHGWLPKNDTMSWYPHGWRVYGDTPPFRYYVTVAVYTALRAAGSRMDLYKLCVLIPAFMAPLAIFPLFGIVRDRWGWVAALIAAGTLAFLPAYMTRTVAGFYRHEYLAIPLIACSLFFVQRALSRPEPPGVFRRGAGQVWLYGSLSGFFYFLVNGTWAGYLLLEAGVAAYAVGMMLTKNVNRRTVIVYLAFAAWHTASLFWGHTRFLQVREPTVDFFAVYAVLLGLLAYLFVRDTTLSHSVSYRWTGFLLAVLACAALIPAGFLLPTGRIAVAIGQQPTEPGSVVPTVAEHRGTDWATIRATYGVVFYLAIAGIAALLYQRRDADTLFALLIAGGVWTFWHLTRLNVLFALLACIGLGAFFGAAFKLAGKAEAKSAEWAAEKQAKRGKRKHKRRPS